MLVESLLAQKLSWLHDGWPVSSISVSMQLAVDLVLHFKNLKTVLIPDRGVPRIKRSFRALASLVYLVLKTVSEHFASSKFSRAPIIFSKCSEWGDLATVGG